MILDGPRDMDWTEFEALASQCHAAGDPDLNLAGSVVHVTSTVRWPQNLTITDVTFQGDPGPAPTRSLTRNGPAWWSPWARRSL